jgi:hypothetical protein
LDRTLSSTVLSHDPVDSARAAQFLNWPRCGLSIRPKVHWLALEYRPRCRARARIPVRLFSSALPASELYRGARCRIPSSAASPRRFPPVRRERVLTANGVEHDVKEYQDGGQAFLNDHHDALFRMMRS